MKKLIFISALIGIAFFGYSQVDTLYPKSQKKIPCKIVEIGEFDIRYKMEQNPDGPVYVMSRLKLYKYTLANGFTEFLREDELSVEGQYTSIQNCKSVIKTMPFSFVNNQVGLAYEHVIKVGLNLDVELGYINNNITEETASNTYFVNQNGKPTYCTGFYFKPGVKFLLGQDFTLKGLKYSHPLKGRYIKLDLAMSYMNFQDVSNVNINGQSTQYPPYTTSSYNQTVTIADLNTIAYGAFVNYGRQFILANILTLEYYIGIGVTGQDYGYKNAVTTVSNGMPYYPSYYASSSEGKNVSNYHAFFREPEIGISATFGFRVGYIIPEKNSQPKAKLQEQ